MTIVQAQELQPGDRFLFQGDVRVLESKWVDPSGGAIMTLTCRDEVTGEAVVIKTDRLFPYTMA